MNWTIVIIIVILFFVILWLTAEDNVTGAYEAKVRGHEDTPEIRTIEKKIRKKRTKKVKDYLTLGDINRFNINDQIQADNDYALALQLADYTGDAMIFHINDRINPFVPIVNHNIRNVGIVVDAQNVHDSNVVDSLNKKYNIIRSGKLADEAMMTRFLERAPDDCRYAIKSILDKPGYLESINEGDDIVLRRVVARGEHLWDALYGNLKNCADNDGNMVCVTGRVGQILDAMTLIDKDAGKPMVTVSILRKEMVDATANYINNLSEERRKLYDEDDEEAAKVGNEIEEMLNRDYKSLAKPELFDKVMEEIKAGF